MAKSSIKSYVKKRSQEVDAPRPIAIGERKSVDIKKAENGYVVSQWIPSTDSKPGRDRVIVCKTIKEAQAQASKLLRM